MELEGCRPLITGAARGIGRAFVDAFLEAGAAKVYATVRNADAAAALSAVDPRVQPVFLDTTQPDQVAEAAAGASDVNILVNNAGVLFYSNSLSAPNLDHARQEMEVNYFGTLAMCRAFAPNLIPTQGAIVNVLSIAALMYVHVVGTYNATKAAARSMTESLRVDLTPLGVRVLAVYAGGYDTEMHPPSTDRTFLNPPRMLTTAVLQSLVSGGPDDVYPDPGAQNVQRMLAPNPG
jgi:NAD(P)-dependent dehydrogenase (short-subunit alcohol dehydrogenase family)